MEWTYEDHTSPIGETGDSSTETKITNGKLTFYVSDCELDDEELDTLCELLNQMPNLWCAEYDEDFDSMERLKENCPNCHREYDEIDYEYQICHLCKYNANPESTNKT